MRAILIIAGITLFSANLFGDSETKPFVGVSGGVGWVQAAPDDLNATLKKWGQATIDPASLITVEASYLLGIDDFVAEVTTSHTSNSALTPLTGDRRTRFLLDTTEVTLGSRWQWLSNTWLRLGAGVGVSKALLQTYGSDSRSLAEALGETGQVSLVSSWNWSPVASVRFSRRILPPIQNTLGLSMGFGMTAQAFPFPVLWKLNDDIAVTGLGRPWSFSFRYLVWVGLE